MNIPRVYKTKAIVLKHMKLGEADRLLTLYTPYLGKIRAVAKGVARPTSRLGGHTQLLTHSQMMLARGRNLDIVTQSQTIDSFLPLRQDLWRMGCALYAAELVDRFTPEHMENYPVYQLLLRAFTWLCEARDGDLALRYFEVELLGSLGYRPELRHCLGCREPLKAEANFFSPSTGGVLCPSCAYGEGGGRPISVNALKVMRHLQEGDLVTLTRLKVPPSLAQELEGLTRQHIYYLLDEAVKSTAFLDMVKHWQEAAPVPEG